MKNIIKLQQQLKKARKATGLTQEEVARKLYCKREQISYWENGRNRLSLEMFLILCELYGLSVDKMLEDTE